MADTYSKDPHAIARLSDEQRRVTQEGGTEPAFRNEAEGYGAYRHLFDQAEAQA